MDTRRALAALASVLPDDADVAGVDFGEIAGDCLVTIRSSSPGVLIGRAGATSDRLRAALVGALGRDVRLNIVEVLRQPVG